MAKESEKKAAPAAAPAAKAPPPAPPKAAENPPEKPAGGGGKKELTGLSRYFNSQTTSGRANYNYPPMYIPAASLRLAMAGESGEGSELKGLSKYFNSHTYTGRANVAKATYAFFGALILYNMLKPKSKK